MEISRISPLTGLTNTMKLDITYDQLNELNAPKNARRCIQDIFPKLNVAEREFLLTGYTPEDWAMIFPPEEE